MFKKTSIFLWTMTLVCALAVAGTAQGPVPPGSEPPAGMGRPAGGSIPQFPRINPPRAPVTALPMPTAPLLGQMTRILGLSTDQQTKLEELAKKSNSALQPLVEEQNKATRSLAAAVLKPKAEKSEIQKAVEAAQKAESAVISGLVNFWTEAKALLSEEQINKLNQMLSNVLGVPRMMDRGPGARGATGYGQTQPGGPPPGPPGPGAPPPGGPPPGAPGPPPEQPLPPAPGE